MTTFRVYTIHAYRSIDEYGNMQFMKSFRFICPTLGCALKKTKDLIEEEALEMKKIMGQEVENHPRSFRVASVEEFQYGSSPE